MSAPAWLVQQQPGLCPCACAGRRTKAGFIDKTILGSVSLMRRAMFADDVSAGPGLLQRVDPRVKLATLLGLVVTASLVHHLAILAVMYLSTLPLARLSGLSLGFFVKRVWLFIPIFTGIVVIPATFSFITAGDIVVPLGDWFGHRVGLTSQGLRAAATVVARVATSISFVVLLTVTTPWAKLLAALRALRVPKMFVLVTGMAYRYVFHLLDAITDMYTSRKARTAGRPSTAQGRAMVGATAGALFGKAHALSDEVYAAMVSRGFTGEAVTLDPPRMRARDLAWTVGCAIAAVSLLWGDRVVGR